MSKNRIEEVRMEREAERMAMDALLSVMESIAPDEIQPLIQTPKLCNGIIDKAGLFLSLIADTVDFESSVKLASEANELLSRVNEALEAFIEQHKEGGLSE